MADVLFEDALPEVQRFSLSLADICNGINCVSNMQFTTEEIVSMAGHIASAHSTSDTDPDTVVTAVMAVPLGSDAPSHPPIGPDKAALN